MRRNLPNRRVRAPELFSLLFCDTVLRVQASDADSLWAALSRSTWSEPIALRGIFTFHKAADVHTEEYGFRLLGEQLTPQRLVMTIEQLVKERQLSRKIASRLEEGIFGRTTPNGTWAMGDERSHAMHKEKTT